MTKFLADSPHLPPSDAIVPVLWQRLFRRLWTAASDLPLEGGGG
jgi:hypothetical protein